MTSFSWIWRFQHLKIRGKLYSSHVLCPNVAIFLKNVFIFKDRTLKKNNIERKRISMWFGRENDENVVRTRDWCGWPSSPRSGSLRRAAISWGTLNTEFLPMCWVVNISVSKLRSNRDCLPHLPVGCVQLLHPELLEVLNNNII